jgi:hypothetical protein
MAFWRAIGIRYLTLSPWFFCRAVVPKAAIVFVKREREKRVSRLSACL